MTSAPEMISIAPPEAAPSTAAGAFALPTGPVRPEVTWQELERIPDLDHLPCTSPILTPNGPWFTRHLLIPHSVIRFDLLLMERAVQPQYFQPHRTWKVQRFFKWYDRYFLNPTHHHHAAEEDIYFPWIATRGQVHERMSADHRTMMTLLAAISAMGPTFASTTDPKARDALAVTLRERVHELAGMMREHLNEEEVMIPPILRDKFTEAEAFKVVGKIVPSRGADNLWLLPAEVINQSRIGGDDSRDYLMTHVPGVLRWHWRKFSRTWYKPENMDYINALILDSDVEPARPKYKGYGPFRWYPE